MKTLPVASPVLPVIEPTLTKDVPFEIHSKSTIITDCSPPQTLAQRKVGALGAFSSTFLTIFLAEIGDKTQLATLLMSAQSHAPWVVFAGSAMALMATSLLGVLLGRWLSNRLSPKVLDRSAGLLLLFISLTLFWDVFHSSL